MSPKNGYKETLINIRVLIIKASASSRRVWVTYQIKLISTDTSVIPLFASYAKVAVLLKGVPLNPVPASMQGHPWFACI
jgi:hypothetical protein